MLGVGRLGRSPEADAAACASPCLPAEITVLSLNVLCSFCGKEGYDDWPARRPHLRALIADPGADVIALQEVSSLAVLADLLGEDLGQQHTIVAAEGYTDSVLLFRRDRFHAEDTGEVWLSLAPTLPFSWGWQPLAFPRLAVWARLRDRQSGQALLVVSTHLDNNPRNKSGGAEILGERFAPLAAHLPVLLLGDLNLQEGDARLDTLRGATLADAASLAQTSVQEGALEGALHTRRELRPDHRIDHVLVGAPATQTLQVSRWRHLAPVYGDPPRRPSDHPAVVATIALSPPRL